MAKKELDWHDRNAKRDISISLKLLGVIAGIVTVGTVSATLLSIRIFDRGMTADIEQGLDYTASGVETTFTDWQTSLSSYTAHSAVNAPRFFVGDPSITRTSLYSG